MPYCPSCKTRYDDGAEACWRCRVRLVAELPGGAGEPPSSRRASGPVPIYEAPDEFSALRVQALLEGAGMIAVVESAQIPWIDGVLANIKGSWGRVLVHPADREAARELVAGYRASLAGGQGD